jgi:hypothetical protein
MRAFVMLRTQTRAIDDRYQQAEKPKPDFPKTGVVLCSSLYIGA